MLPWRTGVLIAVPTCVLAQWLRLPSHGAQDEAARLPRGRSQQPVVGCAASASGNELLPPSCCNAVAGPVLADALLQVKSVRVQRIFGDPVSAEPRRRAPGVPEPSVVPAGVDRASPSPSGAASPTSPAPRGPTHWSQNLTNLLTRVRKGALSMTGGVDVFTWLAAFGIGSIVACSCMYICLVNDGKPQSEPTPRMNRGSRASLLPPNSSSTTGGQASSRRALRQPSSVQTPGLADRKEARSDWWPSTPPSVAPSMHEVRMREGEVAVLSQPHRSTSERSAIVEDLVKMPVLCSGLVVPMGSECQLAVQVVRTPIAPREPAGEVDILDLSGKPVFKAHVVRPAPWGNPDSEGGRSQQPCVATLLSLDVDSAAATPRGSRTLGGLRGSEGAALAVCRAAVSAEGRPLVNIFGGKGEFFGRLMRDALSTRYLITLKSGHGQLFFDGIYSDHEVWVTNDRMEQLADTKLCDMTFDRFGRFYQLRVSASVDVGLVLCGLLSIDAMEAKVQHRAYR